MPQNRHDQVRIQADAFALILLAAGLLILPLQWIAAALAAAIVHEFWHWAAVSLCGGKICRIHIGARGAKMDAPPMSEGKKILCSLAGPLGGLTLLFLARWMPRTALCAAVQSAYNLLPVFPLDGGQALQSLTTMLFPRRIAEAICNAATAATCLLLLILGVCAAFIWHAGLLALLLAVAAVVRIAGNSRKTPCKAVHFTIQ